MNQEADHQEFNAFVQHPAGAGYPLHRSYLLRLWRSSADGELRASLQSVQSGARHTFANLDSLLAFLVEQSQPPSREE